MTLRVVGAGLPRTGTMSLKKSLERVLDGRCYHMMELQDDGDPTSWMHAFDGDFAAVDELLAGWTAAVDWPASILWRELAERHADALVVLSHRGSAETWWKSADATVWEAMRRHDHDEHFGPFNRAMSERAGFPADLDDADGAMGRYDTHFAEVVEAIPADRLLLWQPHDGWEPLCERLGVPIPDDEPVHVNSTAQFRERAKF